MYIEINKLNVGWEKNLTKKHSVLPNANRINFTREQDSILGTISSSLQEGQLNVLQKIKIDIISIDVKSGNELFAKYFVNL
jgi:glycerol-3-phosphate cytidylyltransferase-like family protein